MSTALLDEDLAEHGQAPEPDVFHVKQPEDTGDQAASDEPDPDAPYGRNPKTGKPYRYSADERRARAQAMNEARWGASRTVPKAPGRTSGTKTKSGGIDYRTGIAGLLQLPAFALGIAARMTGDHALALDAATVTLYTPSLAQALDATAQEHAWLADILDKAMQAGPYGAILGAFLPLCFQLAANHGKMAPNPDMGILDEDGLRAALDAQTKTRR